MRRRSLPSQWAVLTLSLSCAVGLALLPTRTPIRVQVVTRDRVETVVKILHPGSPHGLVPAQPLHRTRTPATPTTAPHNPLGIGHATSPANRPTAAVPEHQTLPTTTLPIAPSTPTTLAHTGVTVQSPLSAISPTTGYLESPDAASATYTLRATSTAVRVTISAVSGNAITATLDCGLGLDQATAPASLQVAATPLTPCTLVLSTVSTTATSYRWSSLGASL